MKAEPATVYMMNFIAAYSRRGAAPDPDEQEHRDQLQLPEQEEEEQVERR